MELTIKKEVIPEGDLPSFEVEFTAHIDMVDNSFTHAFGTQTRLDPELRSVKYDKWKHTEIENQLIYEWTLENADDLQREFEEIAQDEHDNGG